MNRSALRVLAWPGGFTVAGVVLFTAYLVQSARNTYVNSDGASNALQAWDMLHGNLLLHGWALADVSFYTTDMPQYMLVEAIRGLGPDAVHISAALTYTVLVLLAGWLAKGQAAGAQAVTRVLVASGIMLAPQLGLPTGILLLSPDHVATCVPLLLAWLVIDRFSPGGRPPGDPPSGGKPSPQAPLVVWALLAWTAVGDPLAEVIGALPLAVACAVRVFQSLALRREPVRDSWYHVALVLAAVVSVPTAWLVTRLIADHGGWTVTPFGTGLAGPGLLGRNASLTGEGILQLFGADFLHQPGLQPTAFAFAHLTGLGLVAWAFWLAVRRFLAADLLVQVLAAGIVVNLAAYAFTVQAQDLTRTREIVAVLPFGAVLAGRLLPERLLGGRLLGGWLAGARLAAAMSVVLAAYAGMLVFNAAQPPVPAPYSDLARWLAAHHLTRGLAGYWQASSVTVDSGGQVQLRPVTLTGGRLASESWWDSQKAWFDPAAHQAFFIVSVTPPGRRWPDQPMVRAMEAVAGPPYKVYRFRRFTIPVWHQNLLSRLG